MSVTTADFDYVSHLVTQRSAIVLTPEKTYLVESRLTPLASDLGYGSISGLVQRRRTGTDRAERGRQGGLPGSAKECLREASPN